MTVSGADILVRTLAARGVDTIFTVSGNQILPIFDVAGDAGIRLIHMRHETAAVYAAIGAAETTGKTAVVLVSAGPGFLASLQGLGVAVSMELPVLLLTGGAPVAQRSFGGFQHLDQQSIAEAAGASSCLVESAGDVPEALATAWTELSGAVPRPAHLELATNALLEVVEDGPVNDAPAPAPDEAVIPDEALATIAERLAAASRPVVIARPSAARGEVGALLSGLCERLNIQPLITESPRGLSDLKYLDGIARLPEADCALVIGPSDFASGFLSRDVLARDGFLAIVDASGDPEHLNQPDAHIRGDQFRVLQAIVQRLDGPRSTDPEWSAIWKVGSPPPSPDDDEDDGLHPLTIVQVVREMIGPGDLLVLDGGEFCQWIRLGLRDLPNRMLWNGKLGAIGGGIPMAVGVAARNSSGRVIVFLGDGSAGYHLSEFETASRYGLPFVAIVGNDARWAAEWHMQASRYGPDRAFETELTWARYDIAAAGFGGIGYMAANAGDLWGALNRSLAAGLPACINVYARAVRSPAVLRE